jgi:hypothetical protein
MPRKPATQSAESPARCSSPFSKGAWRMSRRPVRVSLDELPEALARAAAGDPTAVAFRTYKGEYGLVGECDWPNVSRCMLGRSHRGYFRLGLLLLHDWLVRPLPGFIVHHRNGLKRDNRRRNLQVLRLGDHTSLHRRETGGPRSGLYWARGRWIGRWDHHCGTNTGCFRSWEITACVRDDCLRHLAKGALSVFDGRVLDHNVPALLAAQGGRAMGFTFVGRGDGAVHHLSGIARRKCVDANDMERLVQQGLLLVWSGNRLGWRRIPLEGLLWVTARGRNLRVIHNREGSLCHT